MQRPRRGIQRTCVQGLDKSHYRDPEDIAPGLVAAKIMVIVFKADDTGEVTPFKCLPLDAPEQLPDGQLIEAGWTISVI